MYHHIQRNAAAIWRPGCRSEIPFRGRHTIETSGSYFHSPKFRRSAFLHRKMCRWQLDSPDRTAAPDETARSAPATLRDTLEWAFPADGPDSKAVPSDTTRRRCFQAVTHCPQGPPGRKRRAARPEAGGARRRPGWAVLRRGPCIRGRAKAHRRGKLPPRYSPAFAPGSTVLPIN